MSGPPTKIAREQSDRAGGGGGGEGVWWRCPPSPGQGKLAFGARKTNFSHYRQINKAPWPGGGGGGGSLPLEAVPHPLEKTRERWWARNAKGVTQTL